MKECDLLLIGLGNPILGDDGVGWHIANLVQNTLESAPGLADQIQVDCLAVGGLSLMERMVGFKHVILVDALTNDNLPSGTVICTELADLQDQSKGHLASAHDISLQQAIELGRMSGAQIPDSITIIGVVASHVYDFSELLSPAVEQAVPRAAQQAIKIIHQLGKLQSEGWHGFT